MAPEPQNYDRLMLNAMSELTRQLQRNLEFLQQQEDKAEKNPILRQQQDEQMSIFQQRLPETRRNKRRRKAGQEQLFNYDDQYQEDTTSDNLPPDSGDRNASTQEATKRLSLGEKLTRIKQNAQTAGGYRASLAGYTADPEDDVMTDQGALSLAVLGKHGGPSFIRNLALESYGLQRSLKWAQGTTSAMSNAPKFIAQNPMLSSIPGINRVVNDTNIGAFQGALGLAQDHPFAAYAAYKAGSMTMGGMRNLGGGLQNWEQIGASLGVPTSQQRYFAGFHNPLSPFLSAATSVGAGFKADELMAEGRLPSGRGVFPGIDMFGLSKGQAQQAAATIASQGWGANENKLGGGEAGALFQGLFTPLMKQFPNLSGEDLGQFLPYLRNSGTSIDQLRGSLQDLGTAAQATHETIGEAASTMIAFNQATVGMGSNQGGLNAAQGFRNITGMDPQVLGQMMQNPLMQGFITSRLGVLPSGQRDINPGTLAGLSRQTVGMLMNATRGLNRNVYDPQTHQLIMSGAQAQIDQVAQMMGVKPEDIRRITGDTTGESARQKIVTSLGAIGQGGFLSMTDGGNAHMTAAGSKAAQQFWMKNIAPNWKGSGISQQEMNRLNHMGFQQRIKTLRNDLNTSTQHSNWNQLQQHPNAQTVNVQIGFTGMAAKFFQQQGPTTAKQAANAGQVQYGSVANSVLGDVAKHAASFIPGANSAWDIAHGNLGAAVSDAMPAPVSSAVHAIEGIPVVSSAINTVGNLLP